MHINTSQGGTSYSYGSVASILLLLYSKYNLDHQTSVIARGIMALVPYSNAPPTTHQTPYHPASGSYHANSYYSPRDQQPSTFSSEYSSGRHSSSLSNSSSYSSGSSHTSISVQTFGSRDHPDYAPGQAPRVFFYNAQIREQWDCAPRGPGGKKVKSSRWESRGRTRGRDDDWPESDNGSRHSRQDSWRDDSTVSPADSISQVLSRSSRVSEGRSRTSGKRIEYHYPESEFSRKLDEKSSSGRSRSSKSGTRVRDGRVHVANDKFVMERIPE